MMGKRAWDQHFGEEACPRFIALAGDCLIEADNSLDWLLDALKRDWAGQGQMSLFGRISQPWLRWCVPTATYYVSTGRCGGRCALESSQLDRGGTAGAGAASLAARTVRAASTAQTLAPWAKRRVAAPAVIS